MAQGSESQNGQRYRQNKTKYPEKAFFLWPRSGKEKASRDLVGKPKPDSDGRPAIAVVPAKVREEKETERSHVSIFY